MRGLLLTVLFGLAAGADVVAQSTEVLLCGKPAELNLMLLRWRADEVTAVRRAEDTLWLRAPDSAALRASLRRALDQWHRDAYLLASIDGWRVLSDSTAAAQLYLGPRFHWVALRLSEADERWLDAIRLREQPKTGAPLLPDQLLRWQQSLLERAENRGYPFAAVRLDSIRLLPEGGVSATLAVERGPFIAFAEPRLYGNVRLSPRYLARYLGLRPGAPYSYERVRQVPERLRTLLFVEPTAEPSITFSDEAACVNLFLQRKRASRFDLVIGLLPQPNDPAGRLLLTGALQMALLDALHQGERISAELERLRPETQKLDVQAAFPYLMGTPWGLDGRFLLFRRDSTWIDAQGEIGVQYFLEGADHLKFFAEGRTLSLQTVDTARVLQTRQLPAALDMRQQAAGIEVSLQRLDYRFNPRQGWALWMRATAGFSRILPNAQIETLRDPVDTTFRFASLYDGLTQPIARYQTDARIEVFTPLGVRTTTLLRLRIGAILADRPIFTNEQYRLGGHKLMRGFDEESLFATRFAVASAEIRLLTGRNAYWAVFADAGYLENTTDRQRLFLRPRGAGAGIYLETQAGIFGISLAIGARQWREPFEWRAPKLHLGYVNWF